MYLSAFKCIDVLAKYLEGTFYHQQAVSNQEYTSKSTAQHSIHDDDIGYSYAAEFFPLGTLQFPFRLSTHLIRRCSLGRTL